MANGILVNKASSGQSLVFNFSLTFTQEAWQHFWRCLVVGCVMADSLINTSKSDLAVTWNQLSTEVANLLRQGEVRALRSETQSDR